MIQITRCPVCGGQDLVRIFTAVDHLATGDSFHILECSDCNVRVTNPVPDEAEIHRYYDAVHYRPYSEQSGEFFDRVYRSVRGSMLTRKRKLIERESGMTRGRLLDVGCGSGAFMNEMYRTGWTVDGIEASDRAREVANSTYGLKVGRPDEWLRNREPEYDVITLWHSLEHVHDLSGHLKAIWASLKEDGRGIVAVPNYESLDAGHYQYRWAAYDVPRHLYHFNYQSMAVLLERHDFELVKIRGLPFDSFYVSILSEQSGTGKWVRGMWIGLRSYLRSLSRTVSSSSIIYIFRKMVRRNGSRRDETFHVQQD